MNKTKISTVDAYQGMDETDFIVMDQEINSIFNSDQRNGRKMTTQFFLHGENSIVLEVYWDDKKIQTIGFKNKGTLTEKGRDVINGKAEKTEVKEKVI